MKFGMDAQLWTKNQNARFQIFLSRRSRDIQCVDLWSLQTSSISQDWWEIDKQGIKSKLMKHTSRIDYHLVFFLYLNHSHERLKWRHAFDRLYLGAVIDNQWLITTIFKFTLKAFIGYQDCTCPISFGWLRAFEVITRDLCLTSGHFKRSQSSKTDQTLTILVSN